MVLLGLLLLCNVVLHAAIIGRFSFKGNEPPAVFGILYAGLALAVFRDGHQRAGPVTLAAEVHRTDE